MYWALSWLLKNKIPFFFRPHYSFLSFWIHPWAQHYVQVPLPSEAHDWSHSATDQQGIPLQAVGGKRCCCTDIGFAANDCSLFRHRYVSACPYASLATVPAPTAHYLTPSSLFKVLVHLCIPWIASIFVFVFLTPITSQFGPGVSQIRIIVYIAPGRFFLIDLFLRELLNFNNVGGTRDSTDIYRYAYILYIHLCARSRVRTRVWCTLSFYC